jgi:hypothetical protein
MVQAFCLIIRNSDYTRRIAYNDTQNRNDEYIGRSNNSVQNSECCYLLASHVIRRRYSAGLFKLSKRLKDRYTN